MIGVGRQPTVVGRGHRNRPITLKRLEQRGLVRHKAPYWAIGHDDHLATYAGMQSTVEAIEERLETEDPDDWLANAEPVDES